MDIDKVVHFYIGTLGGGQKWPNCDAFIGAGGGLGLVANFRGTKSAELPIIQNYIMLDS